MEKFDYDRALYYAHRSQWDNLLILMLRTEDDFLSKYIEAFLYAYHFSSDLHLIERSLHSLFCYIEHATDVIAEQEGVLI